MRTLDLDSATIPDLRRLLDAGTLTAVALTEAYLTRIRTFDARIRAVLFVDPSAVVQAAASDRRRAQGAGPLGPLDGIPVLLKDNIDTRDLPTTAGSHALLVAPPAEDAPLVSRLRAAGAVLLGKTNLSEWANFRSTRSTSGWSALGGQTVNPHVLDRNPSGSSSGSAAAVAASLAQVAIGTETDGSIVGPGGACGVAGIKPTVGLVSRSGIVPISAEQDTPGPMARHVIDLAITLAVLQGEDPDDPATVGYPGRVADYVAALDPDVLQGARIGVWRIPDQGDDVDAVLATTVDTLVRVGAIPVPVDLPDQADLGAAELPSMWAEFKDGLARYLATRPDAPQTLAELIDFNLADPVELSRFGQDHFEAAVAAPPLTDPAYRARRARARSLARASIDETMAAERLDAIVVPSNGPAWLIDYETGDKDEIGSSSPAAVAGYPTVTVPAGFVGPLPIGMSFIAGRYADARVLAFAAAFENASKARRPPGLLSTLP
ncbi:MAG TPA: amidase [Pseudonocardiaceae bacterium]|jgi:amidase|nr:amidase [Pseudonocardiaceae bacterium]